MSGFAPGLCNRAEWQGLARSRDLVHAAGSVSRAAVSREERTGGNPRPDGIRADGVRRFTRSQAARYLGKSLRQIRWLEESGVLKPKIAKRGVRVFERGDLDNYRRATPGSLAARAFACFEAGKTPAQAVIQCEATPQEIETLHDAWVRMSGAWTVAGPKGPRLAWERTYGIGEITPTKLRRALELVATRPDLRERLLAAS